MDEILSDLGAFLSNAYRSADYLRIDGGSSFRVERHGMVPFFAAVVKELEKSSARLWHVEACASDGTTLWEYMGG